MTADITSRLASAFAAGKREGFEEAAKLLEDRAVAYRAKADPMYYVLAVVTDDNASAIRTLSSAPPPATAQPRSEEIVSGDADGYTGGMCLRQKIVEARRVHGRQHLTSIRSTRDKIARAFIAAVLTTPSPKPEDALREAAYSAGVMLMVRNPA